MVEPVVRFAVLAAVCVALLTPTGSASAWTGPPAGPTPPIAVAAKFPAKINFSVAPGGSASLTSPDLGTKQKSVSAEVIALSPSAAKSLQAFLSELPSIRTRVLACVLLNNQVIQSGDFGFDSESTSIPGLFLALCSQMAIQLSKAATASTAAQAAATACPRARRQVGLRVTRVGRRYRGTVKGKVTPTKRASPLNVTCRRTSRGFALRFRPASRRRSLRSVLGPRLSFGLQTPATARSAARLQVVFRNP